VIIQTTQKSRRNSLIILTLTHKKYFARSLKKIDNLAMEEYNHKSINKTLNELLQLLTKEEVVAQVIDLMYMVRKNQVIKYLKFYVV